MTFGLLDNLRRASDRCGSSIALKEGPRQIRYDELWQTASRFAAALRQRGFSPGDRAAIVLPNSIDYVVALYGVLKAGGIAVPLNPIAKGRDFAIALDHCGAVVAIGSPQHAELAEAVERSAARLQVTDVAGALSELLPSEHGQDPPLRPEQAAMIVYTSGTTRQPKGVTLSHGNLASNTAAILQSLELRKGDSIVCVLPFCFSYGNSVLHTHLSVGGCLVLERNFVYPQQVVDTMQNERVTGFAGVPSTYALLLSRVDLSRYDLTSLRYVTQAGGHMSPVLAHRVRAALPGARLYQMYGQTEATARISCLPAENLASRVGSVGKPIDGVRLEVRRENGESAAHGEAGEVWVRGPNVMLGYWRDDAATAAVMRDGWLNTGDFGHLDGDGYLYLHGRRSDIVKVGAYRVHPEDVEDVIAELPAVREVAVIGVDDELLGQTLKAFVVPNEGASVSAKQVQAHCRTRLAAYKIPKTVAMVAALPKTHSGKVRRVDLESAVPV